MRLRLITSLTAFLFGFTTFAQNIDIHKIDSFVSHIENNDRGIGSVSIFKDGKEVYNRSFGQPKLTDIQYNADTKYQIGSITKTITATLIFKLIESNKLQLDDKLSKFYQRFIGTFQWFRRFYNEKRQHNLADGKSKRKRNF